MNARWLHATGLAVVLVSGCGGGGGGGGGSSSSSGSGGRGPNYPLTITVAQNPITGSIPQVDLPSAISFDATVTGTTSATTVYVVIVDSAATFNGAPNVSQTSATQYRVDLAVADTLTMGAHPGSLQISICSDQNCANVLGRTTVNYTFTVAENPIWTGSLSPSSVTLTMVKGDDTVNWPIKLTTPTNQYLLKARFTDPANVLRVVGSSQTVQATWGTSDHEITVSPDVAPGTYSGNLEMVYCRDAGCNKMYRGVTKLPYTVTVYALSNLKSLGPLSGATDWTTIQGSSAHTGYVPVTLNPANFSPRWLWKSPDPTNLRQVLEPVTSGGKVFTVAAPEESIRITPLLFALDEASGQVAWQQPIADPNTDPTGSGLGPFMAPAIAGSNVYLARMAAKYPRDEGLFFGFRVADGVATFTPKSIPEVPASFGDYFSEGSSGTIFFRGAYLTPRGSSIVMAAQPNGNWSGDMSLLALDQTTGGKTEPWTSCASAHSPSRFAGTMAVNASGASFFATNTGLLLADTCETIATPVSLSDGYGPTHVPGTSDVIVVGGGSLVNFDTATRQVKWSAYRSDPGNFVGSPAIADGTIYVQNNTRPARLEARSESTGDVLWSWQPPWTDDYSFIGNVLVTNNLVFASTRRAIYAIDRTTHQVAWVYPYSGKVSISANGVMYVRRGFAWFGSALAAINLH
jgi:hypothetical protein